MIETVVFIACGYLLGSISSAIVLSRLMGFRDPRSEGSKNPGATNVMRIAGKKAAALTLAGDCLKGLLPVLAAWLAGLAPLAVAATGIAAFLGHCFPLFFGFRGGKGVATAVGATVGFDWLAGASLVGVWLLFARVFRISSLAAIVAFTVLPFLVYWRWADGAIVALFAGQSVVLVWRHRGNIQRLIAGTES